MGFEKLTTKEINKERKKTDKYLEEEGAKKDKSGRLVLTDKQVEVSKYIMENAFDSELVELESRVKTRCICC